MPSSPRSETTSMAPTLSAEVGTVRVPSRQDDALRAEALAARTADSPTAPSPMTVTVVCGPALA
jgi:hypothetical protein